MYLLIKAILSTVAMIFIAIPLSQILFMDIFYGFMLIVSIFLIMFGDILLGYKITPFKPLFEPTPRGMEPMELQGLDSSVHYINTVKEAQGKRKFWFNGHTASVINDGKAQIRFPGGNIGFRAHELYDGNIDPKRCKALEKTKGDNIKEMYYLFKDKLPKMKVKHRHGRSQSAD